MRGAALRAAPGEAARLSAAERVVFSIWPRDAYGNGLRAATEPFEVSVRYLEGPHPLCRTFVQVRPQRATGAYECSFMPQQAALG